MHRDPDSNRVGSQAGIEAAAESIVPLPPEPSEIEWLNTATHTLGIILALIGMAWMMIAVAGQPWGLQMACAVYGFSAVMVFLFSTLSHAVSEPASRTRMRAWDQGTIYLMIAGTYTPFIWVYGGEWRTGILVFLWSLASSGLWAKVVRKHKVNAMTVTTYLLLGWVPAVPLVPSVPGGCLLAMAAGGVIYTLGVVFLINDQRVPFFHAIWHLAVVAAAAVHYAAIFEYCIRPLTN